MRRIKEVLRLKQLSGLSDSAISRSARIARSTVKEYLDRAARAGLSWAVAEGLSEEEIERRLFAAATVRDRRRPVSDWEVVEQELRGRGVTLRLLWLEYLSRHPEGWRYTQFCEHFHAWQQRSRPPRMRQPHHAGAALEVDWAGMKLPVVDTGVAREAQVFVACLPCSDLIYAEATWTQGQEDWLAAHVRAFAYIGGCPEMLVPDNTKTGVSEANYWDPVLNRSSQAFARHYEVAIVPARVRKPRDKATAENAVRLVEMWVLAPLRHRQLFSLGEANAALAERVEEFNNRPFAPPRQSLPSRKRGAAAARYSRRSSAASSNRCRPSRLSSANGAWPASISTTTSPSTAISIQCRTSWCNRSSTSL
jgi:transposase